MFIGKGKAALLSLYNEISLGEGLVLGHCDRARRYIWPT